MEILVTRGPNGALLPLDDEQAEKLMKLKPGAVLRVNVTKMRNGQFFRKWWVLAKYAFDIWADTQPRMEYKGQEVQPEFERFRKDLTILAGHYHPVWNIRGEMRVEADSLRWSEMTEETFEKLYSNTIQAVLTSVQSSAVLTEEKLRNYVNTVLRFD